MALLGYRCNVCNTPFSTPMHLARHRASALGTCRTQATFRRRVASKRVPQDSPAAAAEAPHGADANPEPPADFVPAAAEEQDEPAAAEEHPPAADTPAYDSSWKLFSAFQNCNRGAGLAAGDVQDLLQLLHNPDFDIHQVPDKAADLDSYGRGVLEEQASAADVGWSTFELTLAHYPAPVKLRVRDGVKWLQELLSCNDFQEALHLDGAPAVDEDGQRIWQEVWQADAFLSVQDAVQRRHGPDAKVLAMQYYSDKSNVTDKTQVYPFKVALLNLDYSTKIKHLGTLALLPVLKPMPGVSNITAARRDLMRQAISIILKPLRDASHTGLELALADGSIIRGFPRNLNYTADDPEQHAASNVKCGKQCKRQCVRCYCESEHLAEVQLASRQRDLASVRGIQAAMRAASTAKDKEALSKEWGLHPEECGLCGFADEDLLACDPYQLFAYDHLHNWGLGWLQQVINGIRDYADKVERPGSQHHGTKAVKALDKRMSLVPRCEGLILPSWGQYFFEPGKITAKEHLAVQQVLPLLVHNLVDDDLTVLMCQAADVGMRMYTRNRQACFNMAALQQLDESIITLRDKMRQMYGSQAVGTPKVHKHSHVTTDIRRLGHLRNYNSDMFEASHTPLKLLYRRSSKKQGGGQYLDEIVNGLRLRDLLDRQVQQEHGQKARQYSTAYMRAAELSESQLSSCFDTLDLDVLADGAAGVKPLLSERRTQLSLQYREHDALPEVCGALRLLRHRLREFVLGDVRGLGYGRAYRQALAREGLPALPTGSTEIRAHKSAVIAADVPWDAEHFVLQTVRTAPVFHGAPFYDNVIVRMSDGQVQYAQLLLLFEVRLPLVEQPVLVGDWQQLAYVRWYSTASTRGDVLARYGAVPLVWDQLTCDPATQQPGVRCSIIPLSSISRRVHVMPAFEEGTSDVSGTFYVNPFVY